MAQLVIESKSGQSDLVNTLYSQEVTWGSAIPKGMIAPFGSSTAPEGWLICDGSTLNALQDVAFRDLFSAIGTTRGGSGEGDFKIPDLRGTFLRGSGSQTYNSKMFDGGNVSQKSRDEYEMHRHEIRSITLAGAPYDQAVAGGSESGNWSTDAITKYSGSASETKPFNTSVLYCIKF